MVTVPRLGLVSLGCPKNLVDSERLISALVARGYRMEQDYSQCDLVIINTCGFIEPAVEESFEAIAEAKKKCAKILVMGCLGSQKEKVLKAFPDVCEVLGPGRRAAVMRAISRQVGEPPALARQSVPESGILLTPPHYTYLKIAEGCRHRCAYCIIPMLRGPLHSREIEPILHEAQDLVNRGVRELLIIAQDSSDYGADLKNGTNLLTLCEAFKKISPRPWIRFHYVYPGKIVDDVIPYMRDGIILPYLDVPLQHAAPHVLKLMKRPGNIEHTYERIEKWRSICPDVAIRSNFITGFPGETEADFNELLEFLKKAKLDRVGVFPYSDIEGAPANSYDNVVPPEVREERAQILMDLQAEISAEKLAQRVGKKYDLLVDSITEEGDLICRSKYESPDIDGVVIVDEHDASIRVQEGDMVEATIYESDEHDLWGKLERNITVRTHLKFKMH